MEFLMPPHPLTNFEIQTCIRMNQAFILETIS